MLLFLCALIRPDAAQFKGYSSIQILFDSNLPSSGIYFNCNIIKKKDSTLNLVTLVLIEWIWATLQYIPTFQDQKFLFYKILFEVRRQNN